MLLVDWLCSTTNPVCATLQDGADKWNKKRCMTCVGMVLPVSNRHGAPFDDLIEPED